MAEQRWRNDQKATEMDRKANDTMLRVMNLIELITDKREKVMLK
jgi:hypothetical protein